MDEIDNSIEYGINQARELANLTFSYINNVIDINWKIRELFPFHLVAIFKLLIERIRLFVNYKKEYAKIIQV
jgi:hypothetical protein